jgi:hypothetical protein
VHVPQRGVPQRPVRPPRPELHPDLRPELHFFLRFVCFCLSERCDFL